MLKLVPYNDSEDEEIAIDQDSNGEDEKVPASRKLRQARLRRNDVNRIFKTVRARNPRNLTLKRQEKIERFFIRNYSDQKKYSFGDIGSKEWIQELISFMKERRNHKIIPSDVTLWIRTSPQVFEKARILGKQQRNIRTASSEIVTTLSSPDSAPLLAERTPLDSGYGSPCDSNDQGAKEDNKQNQVPPGSGNETTIQRWYPATDFLTISNDKNSAGEINLLEVKQEKEANSALSVCHDTPVKTVMSSPNGCLLEGIKPETTPENALVGSSDLMRFHVVQEANNTYTLTHVPPNLALFLTSVDFVGDIPTGLPRWVDTGSIPSNLGAVRLMTSVSLKLLDQIKAIGESPLRTVNTCIHAAQFLEAVLAHPASWI